MLLTLSLLLACETDPAIVEGECLPVDERLHVEACVVPAGAVAGEVDLEAVRAVELVGATVVDAGSGASPEGCRSFHAWSAGSEVELGSSGSAWVTLEDAGGAQWTVSLTAGGTLPDLGSFGALDLTWSQADNSPFAGEYGEMALSLVDSSGALVAWLEDGPHLEGMDLPAGVTAVQAEEECRAEQECGIDVWYRADVSVDGEEATLRPGGADTLGGYVVTFEGQRVVEELECSETSDGGAGLAVVRAG